MDDAKNGVVDQDECPADYVLFSGGKFHRRFLGEPMSFDTLQEMEFFEVEMATSTKAEQRYIMFGEETQ